MNIRKLNRIPIGRFLTGIILCCAITGAQATTESEILNTKTSVKQQSTKTVTGVILDETGEPVTGANVFVKGTTTGTITGLDGDFTLEVPEDAILVVSYIGYSQQEIPVAGRTNITLSLSEDTQSLDEVVVTALGIKRQVRSIGYSTTLIGGDEFTEARDQNIGNALSGKIAGVSVTGNATGLGGSSRVVIRGNASLTGNNQPLYVVDGIPFDNTNRGNAGTWGGMDLGDGLNAINPDDIAEIQVLKGAAASALYGYRGGNGAILITTKSGSAQKGVSVEINNNLTFNPIYDYRDFQKVYGQGRLGEKPTSQEAAYNSYNSSWGAVMDGSQAVNALGDPYAYNYVDNWKNFYRTGISEQASVAISGKGENISYRFGVSNTVDKSILPNSNLNQQGINMNTTYDITPKLHLTVNANYVFEKVKNRANLSDGNGNVNATLLYLANSYDVRWLKPARDENGRELLPGNNDYFNNPYWLLYEDRNETNRNRLTGGMTLRYDIADWLYAQGQVTRDGYNLELLKARPMGQAVDEGGAIEEYNLAFSEINLNYLIGFNKRFGDFSVNATLGGNRQRDITKKWGTDGDIKGFMVDGNLSTSNITPENRRFKKTYSEYQVNSVYGSADFGYRDFIFLNFTGRNDWFSTLSPDNNSYFYPSVSLSFVFTEAWQMPQWIYTGKLRASYAQASNGTDPYMTQLTYTSKNWTLQGQSAGTINTSTVPNANLKPVSISEREIGLSMQFLESRLGFDLAFYKKTTKDDIVYVSSSSASGFNSAIQNVGEIQNRGIEFMLNADPVRTRDFSWRSTFNLAYNDSDVKYLGDGIRYLEIEGASARSGGAVIRSIVGEPYGQIVGYTYQRDDNGNIVYDSSGIPQRSEQLEVLGNGVYRLTGGFRNDFSYKNFSLGLLLDFKWGLNCFRVPT